MGTDLFLENLADLLAGRAKQKAQEQDDTLAITAKKA
jgi:hypothetical protein